MIKNNVNINQRDINASPICWYNGALNLSKEINGLTATQQDIFYYLMYLGRRIFDEEWQRISADLDDNEDRDIAYVGDEWIRKARLTFEVSVADIVRAINSNKKTGLLIDDINVVTSTSITVNGMHKRAFRPFIATIDGTKRKKIANVHITNADLFRTMEYDHKKERCVNRSFVGFRLWHMAQLSTYAKVLFRLVVQWQIRGETPEYTDISALFGIPDSASTSAYMTRYIQPACDEVGTLLHTDITAIPRYDTKDGRRLAGVKFRFEKRAYAKLEATVSDGMTHISADGYDYVIPPTPNTIEDIATLVMQGYIEIRLGRNYRRDRVHADRGIVGVDMYWVLDWHGRRLPEPIQIDADMDTYDLGDLLAKIDE